MEIGWKYHQVENELLTRMTKNMTENDNFMSARKLCSNCNYKRQDENYRPMSLHAALRSLKIVLISGSSWGLGFVRIVAVIVILVLEVS